MMPARGEGGRAGTYVALLRGVNVGGKNRLAMKDLAAMFEEAGGAEVRTFIQSGNVVWRATPARAAAMAGAIAGAIRERFGFATPVIVRTAAEMCAVEPAHPFARAGVDPATLHVVFLADEPTAARVATLDARRSPPDRFEVRGREVFLHTPGGLGRSKLTNAYFDSRLATVSTLRNLHTVRQLVAML